MGERRQWRAKNNRPNWEAITRTPRPSRTKNPKIDLEAKNTASSPGAKRSAKMDFRDYDRAPEDELNRILWAAAKGLDAPNPTPIHRVFVGAGR